MRFGGDEGSFLDPERARPLDLAAVRADDALLDALGAGLKPAADSGVDRELVSLLAAWVAEVRPIEPESAPDLEPYPVPALAGARRSKLAVVPAPVEAARVAAQITPPPTATGGGWRRWMLGPLGRRLAAAALLVGLASSGVALGAENATPGADSPAITRVSYAERARSVAAAAKVGTELTTARTALQQGRRAEAARVIARIGGQLPAVRSDDGHKQLAADHRQLQAALAASGGPPAAAALVLAAEVPDVKPSDLIGNLTADNTILGGSTPDGNGADRPAGNPDQVLASEPTAGGSNPEAAGAPDVAAPAGSASGAGRPDPITASGQDGSSSGSASDTTTDGDDGQATSDSGSSGNTDPAAGGSGTGGSSGSESGAGNSDGNTSASDEPTTPDAPTTEPSAPNDQSGTGPGSEEPATNPGETTTSRDTSTTTSQSPTTTTKTETSTPAPTTTPSPTSRAGSSAADGKSAAKATSPKAAGFIGPVTEPPVPPTTATTKTSKRPPNGNTRSGSDRASQGSTAGSTGAKATS